MSGHRAALGPLVLLALLAAAAAGTGAVDAQGPPAALFAWDEAIAGPDGAPLRWPMALAAARAGEIALLDAARPELVVLSFRGAADGWQIAARVDLPATGAALTACWGGYAVALRRPGGLVAVGGPPFDAVDEVGLSAEVTPGPLACTAAGDLLVGDPAGARVLTLDRSGAIRSQTAVGGSIAALAAAPGGGFYAAIRDPAEIRRYGANGELLTTVEVPGVPPERAWPSGLVVEIDGEMVVADRHGDRLLVLETDGRLAGTGSRRGWEVGLLRSPAGLARLPDGRLAVADLGNGRIQIFHRID